MNVSTPRGSRTLGQCAVRVRELDRLPGPLACHRVAPVLGRSPGQPLPVRSACASPRQVPLRERGLQAQGARRLGGSEGSRASSRGSVPCRPDGVGRSVVRVFPVGGDAVSRRVGWTAASVRGRERLRARPAHRRRHPPYPPWSRRLPPAPSVPRPPGSPEGFSYRPRRPPRSPESPVGGRPPWGRCDGLMMHGPGGGTHCLIPAALAGAGVPGWCRAGWCCAGDERGPGVMRCGACGYRVAAGRRDGVEGGRVAGVA